MGRRTITPAERKHMNNLRRNGLRVASVYETRLERARRKELRRVLALCRDYDDLLVVPDLLETELDESGYLPEWWVGLWTAAGVPKAQATARDMMEAKAAAETDIWKATLRAYATQRAGNNIVSVTGTWKDSLVRLVRGSLEKDPNQGIEKLTKDIYRTYVGSLEQWQCRRIAQTEAMIGMAEAGDLAVQTLDVKYTKQWCTSGMSNVRQSHADVDGKTVDEDEPFKLPGGLLMFPHDPSMGADASEIINCACDVIRRPKGRASRKPSPAAPAPQPAAPAVVEPAVTPVAVPVTPAVVPEVVETVLTAEERRILEMMAEMDAGLPEATRRAIAKNNLEIEKELKIKKGKPMSVSDADEGHANPNFRQSRSYRINCQTCSPAYLMRTRGFDVTAGPNTGRTGNLSEYLSHSSNFWKKYKNADGTAVKHSSMIEWMKKNNLAEMTAGDYYKFYDEMTKTPGIYEVAVSWQSRGGHSTLLQRFSDGTLKRIDAQVWTQTVLDEKNAICSLAKKRTTDLCDGVMRIDDKLFDKQYAKIFRKVMKKKPK